MCDFNKNCIFATGFSKIINIKFYENPSCGSRVVPCGQPNGQPDGRTALQGNSRFCNFLNAPKTACHILIQINTLNVQYLLIRVRFLLVTVACKKNKAQNHCQFPLIGWASPAKNCVLRVPSIIYTPNEERHVCPLFLCFTSKIHK
jgi:hypothetical protein